MSKKLSRTPSMRRSSPTPSTGVGALTIGSLVSGAAAFVVIALGTRAVGEALFAPVSVLWSLWALTAAAISFPIQHWTIRSAATGGEATVWSSLRRIVVLALVLSLLTGAVSLLLGARLYTSSPGAFALMTACLPLGSLVIGLERGLLAHRGRFRGVAFTIAGENVIRAGVAVGVLVWGNGGAAEATLLGWGVVAGFAIALVPASILVPPRNMLQGRGASVRLLGGFAGANVMAQATLTSGPVLLALLHAPEATVTQVFAILALLRVPYTGIVGASAAITGPLTRMVAAGRTSQLRRWELSAGAGAIATAVAAAALAPLVLPPTVRTLFSASVTIGAPAQSLLAAGGILAVAGLFGMLLLLARHRPRHLFTSWTLGAGAGAVCLFLPTDPVLRVCTAFFVAEAVAVTAMVTAIPPISRDTTTNGDD